MVGIVENLFLSSLQILTHQQIPEKQSFCRFPHTDAPTSLLVLTGFHIPPCFMTLNVWTAVHLLKCGTTLPLSTSQQCNTEKVPWLRKMAVKAAALCLQFPRSSF